MRKRPWRAAVDDEGGFSSGPRNSISLSLVEIETVFSLGPLDMKTI
jgi:hypothetical protein